MDTPDKYRLVPIIVGYRCEGWGLEKGITILGNMYWVKVMGDHGPITFTDSNFNDALKLINHLTSKPIVK